MCRKEEEVKVTGINMKKREDNEKNSALQIIGVPKEETKVLLRNAIITSERAGLIFF